MNKILVVFHSNFLDGLASASIVCEALGKDRVELYPAHYQTPPPEMKGRIVYIIDFSWPPEILLPAIAEAESVTLIDHHETAMKAWSGVDELPEHLTVIFDMEFSGAGLCWNFFNPKSPLPHNNALLQDYDLHAGRFPESHDYAAGVASTGCLLTNDLVLFEETVWLRPTGVVCKEGQVTQRVNRNHIAGMIERSMEMIVVQGFPCTDRQYPVSVCYPSRRHLMSRASVFNYLRRPAQHQSQEVRSEGRKGLCCALWRHCQGIWRRWPSRRCGLLFALRFGLFYGAQSSYGQCNCSQGICVGGKATTCARSNRPRA